MMCWAYFQVLAVYVQIDRDKRLEPWKKRASQAASAQVWWASGWSLAHSGWSETVPSHSSGMISFGMFTTSLHNVVPIYNRLFNAVFFSPNIA